MAPLLQLTPTPGYTKLHPLALLPGVCLHPSGPATLVHPSMQALLIPHTLSLATDPHTQSASLCPARRWVHTHTHRGRNCPFSSTKVCTGRLQPLSCRAHSSSPAMLGTCSWSHTHNMDFSCTEVPTTQVPSQQAPCTVTHTSATSASQCTQVFLHIIEVKEKTTLLLSYGLNTWLIFGMQKFIFCHSASP